MEISEHTTRRRPLFCLLAIIGFVAFTSLAIWVPEGEAGIKREGIDAASPIQTIDSDDFQASGKIEDLKDFMDTLPSFRAQQSQAQGTAHIRGVTSQTWQKYPNLATIDGLRLPDFSELGHTSYDPAILKNFGLGLNYNRQFPGWNDRDHQDELRNLENPFANTSLTPEAVSQPEHVTGLPVRYVDYKGGFGPISMGAMGLDYQFTDPDDQQTQETTDQQDTITPGIVSPVQLALMRLVVYAVITNQSPHLMALALYQRTGNIYLVAEAMALTYYMYSMAMWGGVPPSALIVDQIIGLALLNTWFVILNNLQAIAYRDAALAMASTVLFFNWDVLQAQTIAILVLDMLGSAAYEDRSYVSGVLGFIALRQFMGRDGRVAVQVNYAFLFTPEKGARPISLWEQVSLFPIFAFFEVLRFFMGPVEPNDPLYMKEGSSKKTSGGLRKGLGFLLGAVGAPVQVEDKLADDQWGLHAVGYKPRGTPGSAWDIADGSEKNVVVAVIDSGLDTAHPDGPQYLWTNEDDIPGNGIDDDANGYVDDVHGWNFVGENNDISDDFGHGTFVAGIIAAKRNNGQGIAGINPGAQIMTLKVLNERGTSKSIGVYRAIRYAVDNGARVLNLSVGGRGLSPLEQVGINYAHTMGCIVVVAAGNQSGNIASMNMDNSRRDASNKGLNVALAAPGESVYSLTARFEGDRDQRVVPLLAKDYHRLNGTSFAAPFVAATASLIWVKNPHLNHYQVEDMILATAQDIHDPGWDMPTGQGKLDAYAALSQDPDRVLVPRITEFFVNKVKRRIASVDIYGVVRGDLKNYVVEVGRGTKPKKWQRVYGPATASVDHELICRIDGQYFAKGSTWKVRVIALGNNGQNKSHEVLVSKK